MFSSYPHFSIRKFAFVLLGMGLLGLSATAQNTDPKIGPATGGESKQKIDGALTPETRQTLQDAILSDDPTAMSVAPVGHELDLGPGEAAEIDHTQAAKVPFASLPVPLQQALSGAQQRTLSNGSGE